jgi:hypothetical protein
MLLMAVVPRKILTYRVVDAIDDNDGFVACGRSRPRPIKPHGWNPFTQTLAIKSGRRQGNIAVEQNTEHMGMVGPGSLVDDRVSGYHLEGKAEYWVRERSSRCH